MTATATQLKALPDVLSAVVQGACRHAPTVNSDVDDVENGTRIIEGETGRPPDDSEVVVPYFPSSESGCVAAV